MMVAVPPTNAVSAGASIGEIPGWLLTQGRVPLTASHTRDGLGTSLAYPPTIIEWSLCPRQRTVNEASSVTAGKALLSAFP